jgi:hypothetical protein
MYKPHSLVKKHNEARPQRRFLAAKEIYHLFIEATEQPCKEKLTAKSHATP